MSVEDAVKKIEHDFENQQGPFSDTTFPEERLLMEVSAIVGDADEQTDLSLEDRAALVSAFCTFDYNRDANQLVDNLIELIESPERKWLNAWKVPESEKEVEHRFKEIGFRYPSRDAHAWCVNCQILREKYHGKWSELLLETGLDAEELLERLNSDNFLCLKGVKIAPMYARIVNDDVVELDNLWSLDIPVDTHIRRLSKDLFGDDLSDDQIREEWRGFAIETGISRQIVDGALWHIGNKWDDWGEDYWKELDE